MNEGGKFGGKHILITVVGAACLLCGCTPMAGATPSATAAPVSATREPSATATPAPTSTPLPSDTPTPEPTPSPTPDVRVYNINPRELLLTKDDLLSVQELKKDRYYLPGSDWIERLTNEKIVSSWTVAKGTEYLAATGRVEGWDIYFNRGTTAVVAPEEILDNVVLFRSHNGAMVLLNKYGTCNALGTEYSIVESTFAVGDGTVECQRKVMQSGGVNRVWYMVEFVNRNVYHLVGGWGWEKEIRPDLIEKVATVLNDRLITVPLSGEETYEP